MADNADWSTSVNITGTTVTIPISIQSSAVTLNVNISSSAVTLNVNIASSAATLNINLNSSAITLNINIANQTHYAAGGGEWFAFTGGSIFFIGSNSAAANTVVTTLSVTVAANLFFWLMGVSWGHSANVAVQSVSILFRVNGTAVFQMGNTEGGSNTLSQPEAMGLGAVLLATMSYQGGPGVIGLFTNVWGFTSV